jgi:hypothetical protein
VGAERAADGMPGRCADGEGVLHNMLATVEVTSSFACLLACSC